MKTMVTLAAFLLLGACERRTHEAHATQLPEKERAAPREQEARLSTPSGGDIRKAVERHSEPTIVGTWRLQTDKFVPLGPFGKELWEKASVKHYAPDVRVITYHQDGTWITKDGKSGAWAGSTNDRVYDYDHGTYVRDGKELTRRSVDGFTQTVTIQLLDDRYMIHRSRVNDHLHDYDYFERVR